MTVLPVIVLKCTKQTAPNVYLRHPKRAILLESDNGIVHVTTVEEKLINSLLESTQMLKKCLNFKNHR